MKRLLFILTLLTLGLSANATHYYFSSKDGADGNTGTSIAQAWETSGKFRTLLSSLNAGDTVSFHTSCNWEAFYAALNNVDGAYNNYIVFNSYGDGRRPVLSGAKDVSGTLSESGELWSISSDSDIGDITWPNVFRQVWIDSVYYPPSRYPNSGFLDADGGSTTYINDSDESWTDYEHIGGVVTAYFQSAKWEWTQGLITSNGETTLIVSPAFSYEDGSHPSAPTAGDYFFIQGSPSTSATDQDGESYYEDDGFTVYWAADDLNTGHDVRISVTDTMFHLDGCSYLKFEDLIMEKVNQYIFVLEDCNNIILDGNGLNWSQGGFIRGDDVDTLTIHNNFFHEAQNSCMHLDYCGMVSCRYNDFKNITIRDGLRNLNTRYNSCIASAYATDSIVCQYNDFDSIASMSNQHVSVHSGIDFAVLYDKNVADHYGWVKLGDNGINYNGGEYDSDIRKIYSNSIYMNVGTNNTYNYGTGTGEFIHVFYNDYNSAGTTVENITAFHAHQFAYINGGDPSGGTSILLEDNLTFNAVKDMNDQWGNIINFWESGVSGYPRNDTIINNTFVFGNNAYERAYVMSDLTMIGMDWDNNSFLDPFTYANDDIYREMTGTSVTQNYNVTELCGNEGQDCSSTFNGIGWDYSNVSGTYSEGEFIVCVANGEDDDWYFDLGNCTVKDAETGTNYSDSVLITPYDGKIFMMVSGTRSTLGDTVNWTPPKSWYEELNDTTFITYDTCDYYITVYDTTTVNDSLGFYFENNLTAAYGTTSMNSTGTVTYGGIGACQGSYSIYPDNQGTIYTDQVDLGSDFTARLCYTFYGSNTGTILANRSTGTGWELNRGTGECLEFVTSDGTNTDTVQSAASAIGTDGTTYDIKIVVDVDGGTMSMIVDDVYITPTDSVIQTDFGVDAPVYIGMDAGGNDEVWANLDSLHMSWYEQSITSYDSCVTLGDLYPFDTLYCYESDTAYKTAPVITYSAGVCGIDSLANMKQDGYWIGFQNIDFDREFINRIYLAGQSAYASTLEIRIDNPAGIIIAESDPESTCAIEEYEIADITGTHDIYIVSNQNPTQTIYFIWAVFGYEAPPPPAGPNKYAKINGYRIGGNRKILTW